MISKVIDMPREKIKKRRGWGKFPGGPGVKIQCLHCQGPDSTSGQRTKMAEATLHGQKNNEKNNRNKSNKCNHYSQPHAFKHWHDSMLFTSVMSAGHCVSQTPRFRPPAPCQLFFSSFKLQKQDSSQISMSPSPDPTVGGLESECHSSTRLKWLKVSAPIFLIICHPIVMQGTANFIFLGF